MQVNLSGALRNEVRISN